VWHRGSLQNFGALYERLCAGAQPVVQADGPAFGALTRLGSPSLAALRAARRGLTPTLGVMKHLLAFALFALASCGAPSESTGQAPFYSAQTTVDASRRDAFFTCVRIFAERNSFAVRITPTRPGEQHFLVQLSRKDTKALLSNAVEPSVFRLALYAESSSLSAEVQASLQRQLEEALSKEGFKVDAVRTQ